MAHAIVFIFLFIVFIFSVMIHEISHGFVAEKLGDPTARLAGRLTLNPLRHIDPFGSIILPLLLAIPMLFGQPSIIFGWAKPVPYDPRCLKYPKRDAGKIAAAGPVSNFLLALVFGLIIRGMILAGYGTNAPLLGLLGIVVYVNVLLGTFNIVPIAPLDGSKLLYALLPAGEGTYRFMAFMERYGIFILLLFIFFGFGIIQPIINGLYALFAGTPLGI